MILRSEARDKIDRQVERGAHKAAYEPCHYRQQHPAVKCPKVFADADRAVSEFFHALTSRMIYRQFINISPAYRLVNFSLWSVEIRTV